MAGEPRTETRRITPYVTLTLAAFAVGSCSSATVDLIANIKADPLDILASTFALPYAVLADGLTLGNGKSLGSHSSASSNPPARRTSTAAAERAAWAEVPELDWNDVSKQIVDNARVVVVKRQLERSIGVLFSQSHATCELGGCFVTTRIRCDKMHYVAMMPGSNGEFFQTMLTSAGASNARVEDHSVDAEDQRSWVYLGSKLVLSFQGFCNNETERVTFDMMFLVPKEYIDE